MPPPLPDRLKLEVRLGRDADIEEWLATDTSLDRPVLIRFLGAESSLRRRREFVDSVQQASQVSHPHLTSIYMVEEIDDGAYSVSEWAGGATLESRLRSGDTMDPDEFLPNAAGLAAALGALHEAGVVHGGIDLGAITYTVSHPAKLGAFGRHSRGATPHDDVRSLSEVLEQSLTGAPPGLSPPSELIDGLSTAVDQILRSGRRSALGARALSEAFASAPTPRRPQPESGRPSRRLLMVAAALTVAAAALVGVGRLFTPAGLPIAPPPAPSDSDTPPAPTNTTVATTTTTTTVPPPDLEVSNPAAFDPFGGGGENDEMAVNLLDNDLSTSWRTEVYLDPLPLLKDGVGVSVDVAGTPRTIELLGLTPGAALEARWSPSGGSELGDFEVIGRFLSQPGTTSIRVPRRTGGTWLIWFTDLPPVDGDYMLSLAEIRLRP